MRAIDESVRATGLRCWNGHLMRIFDAQSRLEVQERLLAIARKDERITGSALVGSIAGGTEDQWSDIDIAFGVAGGVKLESVLQDMTAALIGDLGAIHHWDLRSSPAIYRVFLLPDGLEVDIGLWPAAEFGAAGPSFRLVFGDSKQRAPAAPPDIDDLIGMCWHHALHAHAAIERSRPWQAEHWISALRDNLLGLACIRLELPSVHARGTDRLPQVVTAPLERTLVRSLDTAELRRALREAVNSYMGEVGETGPDLAERIEPILRRLQQ